MEIKIIGIAGVARVGKDTLCSDFLKELSRRNIKSQRLAFADFLKEDLKDFLLAKSGVNVYTDTPEDKDLIRPLLVEYGKLMRNLSQGLYWINKIQSQLSKNLKDGIISIISDVRYPNEASWINSFSQGSTIHLSRNGILPANEEERLNDPLVKESCTFNFQWKNLPEELIPPQSLEYFNEISQFKPAERPEVSCISSATARR